MREILFRGQYRRYGEKVRMDGTKLPSKWVYGGVLQGKGDFSIIYGAESEDSRIDKHSVYTDTLGEYTGTKDKNGVKIFEGDIVKFDGRYYEVRYGMGQFCFGINMPVAYKRFEIEVIGNIHDNKIEDFEDGR